MFGRELRDSAEQHVGQEGTANIPRQEELLGHRCVYMCLQPNPGQKPDGPGRRLLPTTIINVRK